MRKTICYVTEAEDPSLHFLTEALEPLKPFLRPVDEPGLKALQKILVEGSFTSEDVQKLRNLAISVNLRAPDELMQKFRQAMVRFNAMLGSAQFREA